MLLLKLIVGVVIGLLVGLTGTGGAFVIPALLFVFRFEQLNAQGTALLLSALPVWFIAFIPYFRSGHFDSRMALVLAAGIIVGSYFGAEWAQHLPVHILRRVLGGVLIFTGLRLALLA